MSVHEGSSYQANLGLRQQLDAYQAQDCRTPTALERYRERTTGQEELVRQLREQHAEEGGRLAKLRKMVIECEDRQCEIAEAVKALTGKEFFEP